MIIRVGRYRFSTRELWELLASALVLSFILAYPFEDCSGAYCAAEAVMVYFFAVGSAFAVHEIAHKITAQGFHVWSEYGMWKGGLLVSLAMKVLLGWTVILPGATYYSPFKHGISFFSLSAEEVGRISLAGPLSNVLLALLFWALGPQLGGFSAVGIAINLVLALFNSIPIPPMDGSKILAWNWRVWLALVVGILALQRLLPAISP